MLSSIKRTFLASLVLLLLSLQGCNETRVVDLTPEFSLDATNNPSSLDQVEQVLIGAYTGFRDADYYGSGSGTGAGWALLPDAMSDNFYETLESLANSRPMVDWTYQPNTDQVAGLYRAPYAVIAAANVVLRDIDRFATTASQQRVNRLKGQAFAMRALAHFDLFRYFATSYDRAATTPALYYSTQFTISTTARPVRLSNKAYYDALFADLDSAITLLAAVSQDINPANGLTRPYIDLAAAYAIQARINLYAKQWAQAETAATRVIALRPLVNLNQTEFSGMYNQTAVGEIIWNVQFESGQGGPTFLAYFATNDRSYFRPAPEVAAFSGTRGLIRPTDIRYAAYFKRQNGQLALSKFQGKGSVVDGNANFPVFRTGEMYLIRAEARAQNGNATGGLTDLNALRRARIMNYADEAGLTGAGLLDAIANERRRELVGEGHRFFDLKRTSRTITRGLACRNAAASPTQDCSLESTDREWTLPIPETVRNANPAAVQNPGY